jgi:F-box associated protein
MNSIPPELKENVFERAADTLSDLTLYGLTCQAWSQIALAPALWARVYFRTRTMDESVLSLNDVYSQTRIVRGTFPLNSMTIRPLSRIAQIANYVCRKICPLDFAEKYVGNRRSGTSRPMVFQCCEIWKFELPYLEHLVVACALVDPYQSYDRKNSKLEKVLCGLQKMDPSSPTYFARITFLQRVAEWTNDVFTKETSFSVRITSDLRFLKGRAPEGRAGIAGEFFAPEPYVYLLSLSGSFQRA